MEQKSVLKEIFSVFQHAESYFNERSRAESNKLMLFQLLVICLFTFLYGVVMGSYHSIGQSVSAGLKLTFLFIVSILICFPSFFVIQQVLGSKMSLKQMIFIVLSGFVLTTSIALSFSPIIVFFQLTGGNYHFLQLLHVAIFIFSGIFGMRLMIDALKYACEKKEIYPNIGVTVFRIWIIILAFVGIQLAWNLRPFLSNKNEEFKVFREYEGNFYTAVVYSFQQILSKTPEEKHPINKHYPDKGKITVDETDSIHFNLIDK
jgi:hypothetical protein